VGVRPLGRGVPTACVIAQARWGRAPESEAINLDTLIDKQSRIRDQTTPRRITLQYGLVIAQH
jgi:hypothetical protein